MSAIAFDLPEDVTTVRDGVLRFVDSEIVPRVQDNHALFEDQRRLYDESGRYSADVQRLIRETRMLSAKAGFYAMCAPEELGSGVSATSPIMSPGRRSIAASAHILRSHRGSFRTGPSGRAAC